MNALKVGLVFAAILLVTPLSADSRAIREHIIQQMELQPNIGRHQIEIDVRQNNVTLLGQVSSEYDSALIEKIAEDAPEVRSVRNYLAVSSIGLTDSAALANEVLQAIQSEEALRDYRVKVRANGAHVTLNGYVESPFDKEKISQVASAVPGVHKLDNRLNIRPPISDEEVVRKLRSALVYEGAIDVDTLGIESENGIVTLKGERSNHRDIDRILSIALMVDGVKDIKSEMTIGPDVYRARLGDDYLR